MMQQMSEARDFQQSCEHGCDKKVGRKEWWRQKIGDEEKEKEEKKGVVGKTDCAGECFERGC